MKKDKQIELQNFVKLHFLYKEKLAEFKRLKSEITEYKKSFRKWWDENLQEKSSLKVTMIDGTFIEIKRPEITENPNKEYDLEYRKT